MRAAPVALAVLAGLLVGRDADARPKKKRPKVSDLIDITAAKPHLVVLTDDEGDIYVVDPAWKTDEHWVFYGEKGKDLYQQRTIGGGADGTTGEFSMRFWSPRVDHRADVGRKRTGEFFVSCGDEETILQKLSDGDARKILDKSAFHRSFWKRQAHVLARDDSGTYYYVDRMRDEDGGKGFRIFSGQAGAMKELPMTNVISDSVGEIYATKKGELRLVASPSETAWIKSGKKAVLTRVPVEDNLKLVYGDLGVYAGGLGTPCDDM
jgi:hypothetical protein